MLTEELRDSIRWERGRPVRIERKARMSDSGDNRAPCGAVRTRRPRSQQDEEVSPHRLAQDDLRRFCCCPCGLSMCLLQSGNLQKSLAGARKQTHQVALL